MIRKLIVLIGFIFIQFSNLKKQMKLFYYTTLYQKQWTKKGNFCFGKSFSITLSSESKLYCEKNITFLNHCNITIPGKGVISLGNEIFFNHGCSITSLDQISIGNNCLFGENVKIYDHNHCFNNTSKLIKDQGYSIAPIKIGNNVWVGSNVTILKGVTIGDNSVIGAGCVITQNIPSNSIVKISQNITIEIIKTK